MRIFGRPTHHFIRLKGESRGIFGEPVLSQVHKSNRHSKRANNLGANRAWKRREQAAASAFFNRRNIREPKQAAHAANIAAIQSAAQPT